MKKLLSLVICMVMMLTLLPVGAAASDDCVEIIGKTLLSGQYLASVDSDPTDIVGTTPTTYVAMYRDGLLTLNDFEKADYDDSDYGIVSENDLTVVLQGENVIGSEGSCPTATAVCSKGNLTIRGSGSLTAYGIWESLNGYTGVDIQGGILTLFARYPIDSWNNSEDEGAPLTISGGTIQATSSDRDGIYCGTDLTISGGTIQTTSSDRNGIYCCADFTISGGTITATGAVDGIYIGNSFTVSGGTVNATGNGHGIYAESGAIIINDGRVTAEGDNYGLYAYSGAMTIGGGTVDASGGNSFGIYAYDTLTISGGDVTANSDYYYGIYAYHTLTVTGGDVTATGETTGILAGDIDLGSGVTVRTGGTVRVTSLYSLTLTSDMYTKTVTEGGLTKYYHNGTEVTEADCPAFSDTEDLHISTFASGDDVYYNPWLSAFVSASPEVVLTSNTGSAKKTVKREDEYPVITGKITSYEELSRLSDDYKAMKEYAEKLGLGDFQVIGTWDVETKGYGPWEIIFHLDAKYLGDTLTIIHKKDDGTFETFTAVVDKNGEATISVTSASPFLVVRGEASGSTSASSVTEENPDTGFGFDFGWRF